MNASPARLARTLALLAGSSLALHSSSLATALSWSNAGGGAASTAANWSPVQVPQAGDALTFNIAGTYTVTYSSAVPQVTSHNYRRGVVTISIASPHNLSSFFRVGDVAGDTATVTVSSGSLHAGTAVTLGNASGTTGTLNVDNEGSLVDTTVAGSDITIGAAGTATLNISDGATVRPLDDCFIGALASSVGHVNISGTGAFPLPVPSSTLDLPAAGQDLVIGQFGDGFLDLTAGGRVNCDEMFVALNPGSNGSVNVGGIGGFLNAHSQINVATQLHLGNNPAIGQNAGSATLSVNSGGVVTVTGTTRIGDPQGVGSGTLTVNDGGVFTTGSLVATDAGGFLNLLGGELHVSGGSLTVRNDLLNVSGSAAPGAIPMVFLDNGAACTLSSSSAPFEALVLGDVHNGQLFVSTGSHLTLAAGDAVLGNLAGSNGHLAISDAGSTASFPTTRQLILGDAGFGSLRVSTGQLTTGSAVLGRASTGTGDAMIFNDAVWNVTGGVSIGGTSAAPFGTGILAVGSPPPSVSPGFVNVNSGVGTTSIRVWSPTDQLIIGQLGQLTCDGVIEVGGSFSLQGGSVESQELRLNIGATFPLAGTILGGLRLATATTVASLTGDLTFLDGASFPATISNSGTIDLAGHRLTITSHGLGSRFLNTCTLDAGGQLSSNVTLEISAGHTLSGQGLVDAPILNFGSIVAQGAQGITFTGILSGVGQGISGTRITFGNRGGFTGSGVFSNLTEIVARAGSTISVPAGGQLTMGEAAGAGGFSSSGLISLASPSQLILKDAAIAGVHDVAFGNTFPDDCRLTCTTGISINGLVTGSGTFDAGTSLPINVAGAARLSPGTSNTPGEIDFVSDTTLGPASRTEIDIFDAQNHDIVATETQTTLHVNPPGLESFPSDLTLGGTLVLRVAPTHSPAPGERHAIIQARGSFASSQLFSAFDSIEAPPHWILRPVVGPFSRSLVAIFCPIDFNNDGDANPDDLGDFITCFFADPPCPSTDFNADGDINPDDLGDFITMFFSGVCD